MAESKPRTYHHGNLRAILVDIAADLIAERGAADFSMAEASRRANVSVAAPYRHFANRDELVAAVAASSYERVRGAIAEADTREETPTERLAAVAGAYVRFVGGNADVFDAIFSTGLDKRKHPELLAAGGNVFRMFLAPAEALAGEAGEQLGLTVGMLAHGYAVAARDGLLSSLDDAVSGAEAGAKALARGRRLLTS